MEAKIHSNSFAALLMFKIRMQTRRARYGVQNLKLKWLSDQALLPLHFLFSSKGEVLVSRFIRGSPSISYRRNVCPGAVYVSYGSQDSAARSFPDKYQAQIEPLSTDRSSWQLYIEGIRSSDSSL